MHPNDDLLNAYADGSLDAAGRAEIDAHFASCAACRQTVDDLREILRATGSLELREPPVRAWLRLERAVRLEREHAQTSRHAARAGRSAAREVNDAASGPATAASARRSALRWAPWLAAAAALVLAVFVGAHYMPAPSEPPSTARSADAAPDSMRVEAELREAESHYENAIKGLEQIASAEQSELDPKTASTLQKNLAVIDQAISESRAAVRAQPTNEPAQQSLIENFKTKIGLLQDTVALINEMRKGNEAGAARIVSGLKDKGN